MSRIVSCLKLEGKTNFRWFTIKINLMKITQIFSNNHQRIVDRHFTCTFLLLYLITLDFDFLKYYLCHDKLIHIIVIDRL